jgi:hypothetical protein
MDTRVKPAYDIVIKSVHSGECRDRVSDTSSVCVSER